MPPQLFQCYLFLPIESKLIKMGKYYEHKNTKSGYLICAVPSCQTKKSTTTLKTFEFPSDLKRRTQWISSIVDATLKHEETSSLEDLYALENRRMELEMEISGVLGDHSYVCARHFRPEDITVHPNVCRLTSNAVPSIFRNYPIELPRQFFKKICQTARNISEESSIDISYNMVKIEEQEDSDKVSCEEILLDSSDYKTLDESAKRELISILSSPSKSDHPEVTEELSKLPNFSDEEESEEDVVVDSTLETKLSSIPSSNKLKVRTRKRLRFLELRHRKMKRRLVELENKINLYNINSLERDAGNNNAEALFLLDMLRTYTVFERTRNEILSVNSDE